MAALSLHETIVAETVEDAQYLVFSNGYWETVSILYYEDGVPVFFNGDVEVHDIERIYILP